MNSKPNLSRISITVPENTVEALDQKIVEEHYESRSQAIVDMINHHLIDQHSSDNSVMVGTLTLLYQRRTANIRIQIGDLQHQYLEQVISSLSVQLDAEKILEEMLLQGKSNDLKQISQQFIALKGVIKGHLELMDAVMPPLQQND